MRISLIAAVSENNVIGKDNKLLWHIPEDLARFKEITMGSPMLMGRKTFESLPKILPGRDHYILTQNEDYGKKISEKYGDKRVFVFNSIDKVLDTLSKKSYPELFVIGGGKIYSQMMPMCDKMYISEVKKKVSGDTYFPEINKNIWKEKYRKSYHDHDFIIYVK